MYFKPGVGVADYHSLWGFAKRDGQRAEAYIGGGDLFLIPHEPMDQDSKLRVEVGRGTFWNGPAVVRVYPDGVCEWCLDGKAPVTLTGVGMGRPIMPEAFSTVED